MTDILRLPQMYLVRVGDHFLASVRAVDIQEAANNAIRQYLLLHSAKHGDTLTVHLIDPGSISHVSPTGKSTAWYQYQVIVSLEIVDDHQG